MDASFVKPIKNQFEFLDLVKTMCQEKNYNKQHLNNVTFFVCPSCFEPPWYA